jgi:hypothetical protein
LAVSEKHNVAEPNILAGGIAYQNWALKSQRRYISKGCASSIPSLVANNHRGGLLPITKTVLSSSCLF